MTDFIAKYWVQTFLGVIVAALGYACKKIYNLYLSEKMHVKTEEQKKFYDDLTALIREQAQISRAEEAKLQEQIDIIKEGVLSIQGREFKKECHAFLAPNKEFSVDEFEHLQAEHATYNKLGGNHNGDILFELVEKKASNILTDDK